MTYHFIGLGGIGMSALARVLLQSGQKVQGSDAKESALLNALTLEGAKVQIGHSEEAIKDAVTVIYSTDIKEDNIELIRAKEAHLPILHRSDLLHELMKGKKNLLVTGTHGKTTTTALLASVLVEAGLDPSFVIGGMIRSLNTNGRAGKGDYFVAEADESDGSFLKTAAEYAIITNLEDDHLNYWGSSEALDGAFEKFIKQTQHLVWCCDDERLAKLVPKGVSYGFSQHADFPIHHFGQTQAGVVFDLGPYEQIELNLLGRHNALNGAAVFALALLLKIPEEVVRVAFKKFSGTGRRLERIGEKHKVAVYDDYGHHPREIRATLKALRDHVRERRLIAVFQPHRFSRVRDLFEEFINCFDDADIVVMTDIYSAGELPLSGITSAALYSRMREKFGSKVLFFPRTHLESGVAQILKPLDVVLTLGAGDVTKAGDPILNQYAERAPKLKVGILFGGTSPEHAVSKMSALNIAKDLDATVYDIQVFKLSKDGQWGFGFDAELCTTGPKISAEVLQELVKCDVCIPVFHGTQGEDGMIGGFLDTLSLPYVGCNYRSGAICMHKAWTKYVALNHNVATAPFFEMDRLTYKKDPESLLQKIEERLGFPVWIKPIHLGSSIGVSRAANRDDLAASAKLAFEHDDVIIVEKEVIGRQIEFAVLGNDYIQIALPAEIMSDGAFVAFDKKYGESAMQIQVPAFLSEIEKQVGFELVERLYRACRCKGLARIDFFLDQKGHFWFNEINPFPGFTDTSAYPKMWQTTGMSMEKLNDELIALAMHNSRQLKVKS
ncbi:MAG: UDP-N-acetylmuramate--L-alanine ligase [Chlamydiae bacterium CG10_big_fil_rev_8_21_14_0_10_42_34]|nr:MAG: UDP-N-acetylmuramate--L-alanine ligase [Chlamydiae bacterium CG10_big_fil_rev_8_21_14_0_10_42_34]